MMGSLEVVFGEACYSSFDAFLSMPVELANGRLWHIFPCRAPHEKVNSRVQTGHSQGQLHQIASRKHTR